MPTYNSDILPDTSGRNVGSASLRYNVYIQNADIAGTFTISSRLGVKNLEDIRFADQFSGSVTQKLDAAFTDLGGNGLVVAPLTLGAGNPTSINAGQCLLDLRSGLPKFFTNFSTSAAAWQLNDDGTVTSQGVKSATVNPASTGFIRAAKSDIFYFRNAANSGDIAGLQKDAGNIVQVGDAAGAKTAGPLVIGGALSGATTGAFSGQITSTVTTGTAPLVIASTTVVPNLNVATLNGVTVSGAASANQYLQASSASAASWVTVAAGQPGKFFLQGGSTTIATGTSSFQNVYSNGTIAAGDMTAGSVIVFEASLACTNNDSVPTSFTPSFQFMLDGQVVYLSTHAGLAGGGTNSSEPWTLKSRMYITSVAGAAVVRIESQQNNAGTQTLSTVVTNLTVDTTASHTVNIQAKWSGTPDTASPLKCYTCQVYKVGA